jgi:hypothetical protein
LAGPILLIGLGVLLLLSNLGYISGSIWNILLRMWPVLLIVVGIDILIGRRTLMGSLLLIALILAVLAGGYWISTTTLPSRVATSVEHVSVPLEGAQRAQIDLHGSAGQMVALAGTAGGSLVEADVPLLQGETLGQDVQRSGSQVEVALRTEGVVVFPNVSTRGAGWRVAIHPDVATTLNVDLGAGEIRIEGREIQLDAIKASLGVGQIVVEIGPGVKTVDLSSGVGEVTVILPAGVAARVSASAALGGSNLPNGYVRQGEWYVSPGFEGASSWVEVSIHSAIGGIQIRQGP